MKTDAHLKTAAEAAETLRNPAPPDLVGAGPVSCPPLKSEEIDGIPEPYPFGL